MRLDWRPVKIKVFYLIVAITILTTLLLKPAWLHSDYIVVCDWLVTIGVFITIVTTFLQRRIHVLSWLVLLLALLYILTTVQFNEEFDFYLMRIEYIGNRRFFISDSLATRLEMVNLFSVVLWLILQSWVIVRLFFSKQPKSCSSL